MNNLFIRSQLNPILKPNPENRWEAEKLYNPGVIYHDGSYHMFYRAVGLGEDWKSSIGYASSIDGERFSRQDEPLLVYEDKKETKGLEDPRITEIDGTFFMAYAAYDGITPRLSIATSTDLKVWKKHGPAMENWSLERAGGEFIEFNEHGPFVKSNPSEWSKSGGIFPEKINGKYLMLFGEYRVWFAESEDGIEWQGDYQPFIEPRTGDYFDNTFVEMGPPPIRTDKGWLVLYHGIDGKHVYRIGFLLLDLDNPRKILYRSVEPIFEPIESYELSGLVDVLPGGLGKLQRMTPEEQRAFMDEQNRKGIMPRVVFCSGATVVDGILRLYYGAGDSVICTSTAKLADLLKLVK